MHASEWLSAVRGEYFEQFVAAGGATVKFVVPAAEADRSAIIDGLRAAAAELEYQFASVDAAQTRLHLADRLFGAIARQIDWDDLARSFSRRLFAEQGWRVPPPDVLLDLHALAAVNSSAPGSLLEADLRGVIEREIFRDYAMTQEFRLAMIQLCLAQLDPDQDPALRESILDWLHGDLRLISGIKRALIFQKLTRYTALGMLVSLTHWLRRAGRGGLILVLDIARYPRAVRASERDDGMYYSTPAVLDLYEVLRQMVDATDELEACFVGVLSGPEFLTDDRRGMRGYQALYFRIADDVHDRFRENPLAPMVRIGGAG